MKDRGTNVNKNFLKILVCIVLTMSLFGGCAKNEESVETPETSTKMEKSVETSETSTSVIAEEPIEANDEQINIEAEQAYMAFLNGKISVNTSEKFRADDGEYNYDGLLYGTYSYEELKAAIIEFEGHGVITKYALVDFGQDGVNELVIRFDNVDPSFLNWIGIIRYNGEGLDLNYSYEDGYRTSSMLYNSGYLLMEGSMGAGASASTLVGFDENGIGTDIFSANSFYGSFVESVAYDLCVDGTGLTGDYNDIAGVSAIEVNEYMAGGAVKLSVSGWSKDTTVREREEALIGELENLGAEIVSEDDMKVLCSLSPYEAPEVTWNVWNDEENTDGDANEETGVEALVSIRFPNEELLAQPQDFFEFIADDTEYQVKVELSTDMVVKNFRVLSLNIDNVNEEGTMVFSENEMYSLEMLTPEKPLVVGLVFAGDIPNMGISYVDANGMERVYGIALSGQDGQPMLFEAELTR